MEPTDLPLEPLDPSVVEGARNIHAMYLALQLAGFTENQAMRLTSDMLKAQWGNT